MTRIHSKFDFIFSSKEEKKKFLGLMNLYLEDLSNEFEQEIGSNNANRLDFNKLGTRVKNNMWNYVVGKISSDQRAIKKELEEGVTL